MTDFNTGAIPGPKLERLRQVPPREVWFDEARNFTPWLLANVDVLNDLLGMDLVLDRAEHPVGDFRLDLKGLDEATGGVVIVENQLERSDHHHLGQIVTYAAGTDAETVIWVATDFRPEHRAAIDWLNSRTDEETRFFAIAIKVVTIGDSVPAPAFELVAHPNDWEKHIRRATSQSSGAVSEKGAQYARFWEFAWTRIHRDQPSWPAKRAANRASWFNTGSGLSGAVIVMIFQGGELEVQLYFDHPDEALNRARFSALRAVESEFESALGLAAEWDSMTGRKAARVRIPSGRGYALDDEDRWPEMADWLSETQIKVRAALASVGWPQAFQAVEPELTRDRGDPDFPDSPVE